MEATVDVGAELDEQCGKQHAIALTQATQMSATQRAEERGRTRACILSIPRAQITAHIETVPPSPAAAQQLSLLLYSLSHVVPTDGPDLMATCRARLEQFLLATIARLAKDDGFEPHAASICRVAVGALDGVSVGHLDAVVALALDAVAAQAAAAPHIFALVPAALGHMAQGSGGASSDVLCTAKVQDIIRRLASLTWPPPLASTIIATMRNLALSPAQEQLVIQAAFKRCAALDHDLLADAAFQALLLPCTPSPQPKLDALCDLFTLRQHQAAAAQADNGDSDGLAGFHAAQNKLLLQLRTLFTRDKALCTLWLKELKKARRVTGIALAITTSLVEISRAAAGALDAIKAAMVTQLRHAEMLEESGWLAALHAGHAATLRDLQGVAHDAVQHADERMAPLYVQVGAHLVLAGKLKAARMGALEFGDCGAHVGVVWCTAAGGAAARLCLAGVAMLEQVRLCVVLLVSGCDQGLCLLAMPFV